MCTAGTIGVRPSGRACALWGVGVVNPTPYAISGSASCIRHGTAVDAFLAGCDITGLYALNAPVRIKHTLVCMGRGVHIKP